MRAAVMVLGDLARSPRTVAHATALSRAGAQVDLIGYGRPEWTSAEAPASTQVWTLDSGVGPTTGPYVVRALMRGTRLFARLVVILLWKVPRPDIVLVQNPPGVPTLLVAWLAARLRGGRLVIDWHNLTWSMLTLRVGDRHPLVRLTKRWEQFFGRRADLNLFVSSTMRDELRKQWGLAGTVFCDQPGEAFVPLPVDGRKMAREQLLTLLGEASSRELVIAVTSTSWSADEDFDLLVDALRQYEATAVASAVAPARLVMVITGRGPRREAYERQLRAEGFMHVGVHTIWLNWVDYPRMLGAADLGICLHRSTSGLDLPMKVLDMFGAGLPVCALDYGPCLSELVTDGVDGLLFRTSGELAGHLSTLVEPGSSARRGFDQLRIGVGRRRRTTWQEAWSRDVWPVIREKSSVS